MKDPNITIIIPVYNVSSYIEACIDSVIGQSYTDIECLLVDDCSTDDSVTLARQRLEKYNGPVDFRIIHNEQNKGASFCRNIGIREAKGDFVFFLDGDDTLKPCCMEVLFALAVKYPEAEMIHGSSEIVPAPAKKKHDAYKLAYGRYPEYVSDNAWVKRRISKGNFSTRFPVTPWNKLVRRSFIVDNGLFFKEGIIHEDILWVFHLGRVLKNVAFSTAVTYTYVLRHGSVSRSGSMLKDIYALYLISSEIIEHYDDLARYERRNYYRYFATSYHNIYKFSEGSELLPEYDKMMRRLGRKAWKHMDLAVWGINSLYLILPGKFYRSTIGGFYQKIVFRTLC